MHQNDDAPRTGNPAAGWCTRATTSGEAWVLWTKVTAKNRSSAGARAIKPWLARGVT